MCTDSLISESDIVFKGIKAEENIAYDNLTMKEYEARIIDYYMKKYDRNVLKIAKMLDIGKSTIYRHLKERKDAGETK
jgi:transcriptional regulator with PAS, ATPase and Fis domain